MELRSVAADVYERHFLKILSNICQLSVVWWHGKHATSVASPKILEGHNVWF